jgi:hypothetical protein
MMGKNILPHHEMSQLATSSLGETVALLINLLGSTIDGKILDALVALAKSKVVVPPVSNAPLTSMAPIPSPIIPEVKVGYVSRESHLAPKVDLMNEIKQFESFCDRQLVACLDQQQLPDEALLAHCSLTGLLQGWKKCLHQGRFRPILENALLKRV